MGYRVIEEIVRIELTPQGFPFFETDSQHGIKIEMSEDESNELSELDISGNSASLRRLGEILIAISKSKDYHVHLESKSPSVLVIEPSGLRLTISNSDKLTRDAVSKSEPPDWARG